MLTVDGDRARFRARSSSRACRPGGRTRTARQPRSSVTLELESGASSSVRSSFRSLVARPGPRAAKTCGSSSMASAVFCRGACWTTDDLGSRLGAAAPATARVGARCGHEHAARGRHHRLRERRFLRGLRRAGHPGWQDFMFANMDYPTGDDGAFRPRSMPSRVRARAHGASAEPCGAVRQ